MTYFRTKKFIDFFFAIFLFLFLLPILVIIYFSILIIMGRPVIFKQNRPGYKNKIFKLLKFRTMSEEKYIYGDLFPDEKRLKSFGKFLRKYSLDELPSLINIIRGEMSFIGPRPLLLDYLKLYNKEQIKRHNVMPGFSGWAQINGRNNTDWDKRFELDIWYVNNQSFLLDLKIFFITIWKTLFCIGVTTKEGTTMPKYKGND